MGPREKERGEQSKGVAAGWTRQRGRAGWLERGVRRANAERTAELAAAGSEASAVQIADGAWGRRWLCV